MFLDIILIFLLHLFCLFGIVIISGLIIGLLNRLFYKQFSYSTWKFSSLFDFIGVPLHEFGHFIMCLIFGHHIDKVVWYNPKSTDGTLGYVNHSYNKRNLYHVIGTFFISFGPIIFDTVLLLVLMVLLDKDLFNSCFNNYLSLEVGEGFLDILKSYFILFGKNFLTIFDLSNFSNVFWWIFIVLAVIIVKHMSLSNQDLQNSWKSLLIITILMFIAYIIIGFIDFSLLESFNKYVFVISCFLFSFLSISIILNLILVFFGFIFNIKRFMKR